MARRADARARTRPLEHRGLSGSRHRVVLSTVVTVLTAAILASCGGGDPATWDLVAIGDSMVAGHEGVTAERRYTAQYAALLGDELGITVRERNHGTVEFRTVADWNEVLGTDQSLRTDLAEAEVVTVFLGAHNIGKAVLGGGCSGDWPKPLKACFRAATASMPADYDRLLAEIRELVGEKTPVVVGYDGGMPPAAVEQWSGKPYWPQMKRILVEDWRPGLYAAAEAHNATVIPFYEQKLDPEFIQSDGAHFNAKGHRFLAELHLAQDGLGR